MKTSYLYRKAFRYYQLFMKFNRKAAIANDDYEYHRNLKIACIYHDAFTRYLEIIRDYANPGETYQNLCYRMKSCF